MSSRFIVPTRLATAAPLLFLLVSLGPAGSRAQTVSLVADLEPGEASSNPFGLVATPGGLVFLTQAEEDQTQNAGTMWLLAPTGTPTQIAMDRLPVAANGHGLLAQSPSSVGGVQSELLLIDLQTTVEEWLGSEDVYDIAPLAEGLVFGTTIRTFSGRAVRFENLYFTDGTPDGTRRILTAPEFSQDPYLQPFEFHPAGDELFFVYHEGQDLPALWSTEGTEASTGPWGAPSDIGTILAVTRESVFVLPVLEQPAPGGPPDARRIVVLDRARPGTVREDIPLMDLTSSGFRSLQEAATLRGRALLNIDLDGATTEELWITDGTPSATTRLGFFDTLHPLTRPPGGLGSIEPGQWTAHRGLAFFLAPAGGGSDLALWRTDGTPEGTLPLTPARFRPQGVHSGSYPVDGVVALGLQTTDLHIELWTSDGTLAGTRLFDIGPGSSDPTDPAPVGEPTPVGDRVYFAATRSDVGRELFALDRLALREPCRPGPHTLCLGDGRFQVQVEWLDRVSGDRGRGRAVPFREDTGQFWFFDEDNVELLVKVLDGRSINDNWWVYFGALSDVAYWLTVVDTWSGESRTWTNEQKTICGVNDSAAFPRRPDLEDLAPAAGAPPSEPRAPAPSTSACGPETLCLQNGRFRVQVEFTDAQNPEPRLGRAVEGTDKTGTFWFYDSENIELAIKVLDGRPVNGAWWVLYGALTDVAYTLEVEDTETGTTRTYENPLGTICGRVDVQAFPTD